MEIAYGEERMRWRGGFVVLVPATAAVSEPRSIGDWFGGDEDSHGEDKRREGERWKEMGGNKKMLVTF